MRKGDIVKRFQDRIDVANKYGTKVELVRHHAKQVIRQHRKLLEIAEAVANIGNDFGYGEYEVEEKFIVMAQEILDGNV
jgi:hypothetical protein